MAKGKKTFVTFASFFKNFYSLWRMVAQVSCLWDNRASRLVKPPMVGKNARQAHSHDGCTPV
jgi:hypothetical protein